MAADGHAVGPVMGVRGGPRRSTQPLAIGPRLPSSALPQASDLVQLSKSAGTLTLADSGDSVSVSPPNATPPVARTSFEAHRERQSEERERNKATRRKLVHDPSLFFDILGEGDRGVRDAKMKRVASDQRLKDLASAGSLASSSDGLPGSSPNLAVLPHSSAGHLGAATDGQQDGDLQFGKELGGGEPLQDADASKLLRELCGDMYIDASQLDQVEPLGQGAFATVQRCRLRRPAPQQRLQPVPPGARPSPGRMLLGRTPSFRKQSSSRSRDSGKGEVVAVKQLKPAVLGDETELHGFIAETDVLRRLRHPFIVEFKGVGAMHNDSAAAMRRSMFLVQELMAGGTLKALLVDAYYSTSSTRLFSRTIAEALAYLHQFLPLIVHRDLKLENILLTSPVPSHADAKLADFGLHKMIKDVASGVPMAQSTEQLQVLLKDMGFEQTTPREVAQHQHQQQGVGFGGPGHTAAPGELGSRQSGDTFASEDGRQSLDLAVAPPMVPAASVQRLHEAATPAGVQPQDDSAHGRVVSDAPVATDSLAAAVPSSGHLPLPPPPPHLRSGPTAGAAAQEADAQPAASTDVPPDLLAAIQSGAELPASRQQQQQQQQQQDEQQQPGWRRWSESSVQGTMRPLAPRVASPFQGSGAVSFQPRLPSQPSAVRRPEEALQQDGSDHLMGQLPLEQGAVLGAATARRSNSGPLSRTMLRAALAPQPAQHAPPCLATKSMGVLGRGEESGPGARLPPLPRGSGVAQRLRSIRMVSQQLDDKVGSAHARQAAVNAITAAKLRESRASGIDGPSSHANSPPNGDSAAGASGGGGAAAAAASSSRKSGSVHGSVQALLALVGSRMGTRRTSVGSDDDPPSSPRSAARRTSHAMMAQLKKVSIARASCGYSSDATNDASVHLTQANMAYRMTGQTGSLCYMAPEVLRGTFYNEKVDVFSLGVVMWELLSYTPTIAIVTGEDMVDRVFQYAERVAGGFRQCLPEDWPPEVRALIADCWQSNPIARPSAARVARRLRAMQEAGLPRQWDDRDARVRRAAADDRRSRAGCCACFGGGRSGRPAPQQYWE